MDWWFYNDGMAWLMAQQRRVQMDNVTGHKQSETDILALHMEWIL